MCNSSYPFPVTKRVYRPRGINALQILFQKHFQRIAEQYESKFAVIYGRFRIERITEVVEKFILCGDYSRGVARIQCTNPDCKYEYFRLFSFKSFYFCWGRPALPVHRRGRFCFRSTCMNGSC